MAEIQADFHGVHERADYEEGTYLLEVAKVDTGSGAAGPYLRANMTFADGKYAGLGFEEIVSLAPKALWRAKQFLGALGYEIPDGVFRFRTEDLEGLRFKGVCQRELDPTGKYPPKLRISTYHPEDWIVPATATVIAGAAAPVVVAPAPAPEGAKVQTDGNGNGAPAPVSRPKVRV
jgi:hypothetical protein